MQQLNEKNIDCPYCGESIDVLIDSEEVEHNYIEDCQVCCKPIVFVVTSDVKGDLIVRVHSEDDAI
jgi:hypothetical protein